MFLIPVIVNIPNPTRSDGTEAIRLNITHSDWNVLQPIYKMWQQEVLSTQTWVQFYTDPIRGRVQVTWPTQSLIALFNAIMIYVSAPIAGMIPPITFDGTLIFLYQDGLDDRGNYGFAMGSPQGFADGGGGPAAD